MAQILKGAPVVAAMNEANAARCAALKEKGIVPTLAVVRGGAREDDISYEKGIVTRCGKVGVEVRQFHLAEDVTQEELLDVIRQINGDASVHGCLIFRPLPKRFDDRRVQEALAPERTWTASRTARWPVCSPICPSVIRPARRRPALRS